MPVQSGVAHVAPDQPLAHVHSATPLPVPHVPLPLHVMPAQSAVPQSMPDQPDVHVHTAVPEPASQLPWPLQLMPVQSATAHVLPDQPLLQVHTAAPELASQLRRSVAGFTLPDQSGGTGVLSAARVAASLERAEKLPQAAPAASTTSEQGVERRRLSG